MKSALRLPPWRRAVYRFLLTLCEFGLLYLWIAHDEQGAFNILALYLWVTAVASLDSWSDSTQAAFKKRRPRFTGYVVFRESALALLLIWFGAVVTGVVVFARLLIIVLARDHALQATEPGVAS
jgi:hypothetical protein